MTRGFLTGDKHAADVHRQRAVQIFQRQFFGAAHRQHTGVVHQNIQIAQAVHCLTYRLLQRCCIGTIGLDRQRLAAGSSDFTHHRIGFVGRGDVG
ncbi:hypothetical protein D3C80_1617470 [compost metagenome]